MWFRHLYTLLFLGVLLQGRLWAGSTSFNFQLSNATIFSMRHNVYICGLRDEQNLKLVIYKCDSILHIIDSSKVMIGKQKVSDFLSTAIDSLHGKLQIELISVDLKGVCLLRMDSDLHDVEVIKAIEPGRVNSRTRFGSHNVVVGNKRLDLQQVAGNAGSTYFLKLYRLKSEKGNYEYEEVWQQPFTQENLVGVDLLHANEKFIYLQVTTKKAENFEVDVLKVNMSQGFVLNTYPISRDKELYRTLHFLQSKNGELTLTGQVLSAGVVKIWQCFADSFKLKDKPSVYTFPTAGGKQATASTLYHLKIKSVDILAKTLRASIYKELNQDECRLTHTEITFSLVLKAGQPILSSTNFSSMCIADFFTSADKLDRNGKLKLELNSKCNNCSQPKYGNELPAVFLVQAGLDVRYFGIKTDTKKQVKQYYELSSAGKICEKKLVESLSLQENPAEVRASDKSIAVGRQNDKENYSVKIYNW